MAELCSTIQCSFVFTRLADKTGGHITPRGRSAPGYHILPEIKSILLLSDVSNVTWGIFYNCLKKSNVSMSLQQQQQQPSPWVTVC